MSDHQLYRFDDTAGVPAQVKVLIHALEGGVDAGHAGQLAARHLGEELPFTRVATFDLDHLLDYRARRPMMTFKSGEWTEYEEPYLVLDCLRDDEGTPILLLHGHEPDLRWEAFVEDVSALIDTFGVEQVVGIHGIPMGVPHTRPITVTSHATRRELIDHMPQFFGSVKVPATASSLLHFRLGQQGTDAVGFAANVPHYVAQSEYPHAAAELIRQVSRSTGLSLPVGSLEADALRTHREIQLQVDKSEEAQTMVRLLEDQFDNFIENSNPQSIPPVAADAAQLPTADELGEQVEAFLRLGAADDEPDSGQTKGWDGEFPSG